MTISQAVVSRVENLLRQKGLTAYKLIQLSTLPKETYKSLMKGKTKSVDLKTVFSLCSGFNISIQEFFNDPIFDYNVVDLDF